MSYGIVGGGGDEGRRKGWGTKLYCSCLSQQFLLFLIYLFVTLHVACCCRPSCYYAVPVVVSALLLASLLLSSLLMSFLLLSSLLLSSLLLSSFWDLAFPVDVISGVDPYCVVPVSHPYRCRPYRVVPAIVVPCHPLLSLVVPRCPCCRYPRGRPWLSSLWILPLHSVHPPYI